MDMKQIDEHTWEIPRSGAMKVPCRIYASKKLMENIKLDKTLEQVKNVSCLKGIKKASFAMPDAHQGYGFSIGGVAAFDTEEGIISPGGVGYDINCGVRLLRTDLTYEDIIKKRKEILDTFFREIPAGVGRDGQVRLTKDKLGEVCEKGGKWAVKEGYGTKADLERTEEYGTMKDADFSCVSDKAVKRGLPQVGTLGSGNHFLEIQKVEEIYDEASAKAFGIGQKGQVMVMLHSGSRGLGHQVASDYIKLMEDKYGFAGLPDRELINAPLQSELGQSYLKAMNCGVNFAFANRQMMAHWVRRSFEKVFGNSDNMDMVYDVCHNIAKIETHKVDGEKMKVCVHRKGATRSFGPGREEIPEIYRDIGQPVIIPGSMGTASYILKGTKEAEELSFGSTAHGAGRVMSRAEALSRFRGDQVKEDLLKKGIEVKGASMRGIAEETWQVYKDIDEVIRTSDKVGLGRVVAKVVPIGVVKG